MAHYVRFEIYIPVVYTVETNPFSSPPRKTIHAMDELLVSQFIAETCDKYKGVTQSNPISPAPYKGWWREKPGGSVDIDYLVHVFGLVRIDEGDEAVKFFATWKARIEGVENQKYVLVIFYPVQTVGDFF